MLDEDTMNARSGNTRTHSKGIVHACMQNAFSQARPWVPHVPLLWSRWGSTKVDRNTL